MRRGLPALLLLLLLVSVPAAPAGAQAPVVRVTATPEEVPVGEAVALQITVLAPTWFPKPPAYPAFELTNTITRLPPDSSYPTSERVGGETWSGIVRSYRIYPLIGATYRLSGQTMTVTYADPETSKPVKVEVDVPEVEFRARVPAGAEALDPYLAGRRLTLDREVEGEVGPVAVGDALVVRYTAELEGMPAIFLPALVPGSAGAPPGQGVSAGAPPARRNEVPGVSVYAGEPVVEDGEPARRSEKLTFVFEAGGEFTVPAAEIRWWNTETSVVETASVPALTVSVAGPPGPGLTGEDAAASRRPAIALWVALLAVVLLASRRWVPALRSRWAAYQEQRLRSEEYAFARLRKALHGGDPRAAHHALLTWLERMEPGTGARRFARRYGDAELERQIEELGRSLYSGAGEAVNLRHLEKSLAVARRRRTEGARRGRSFALPPMNP